MVQSNPCNNNCSNSSSVHVFENSLNKNVTNILFIHGCDYFSFRHTFCRSNSSHLCDIGETLIRKLFNFCLKQSLQFTLEIIKHRSDRNNYACKRYVCCIT